MKILLVNHTLDQYAGSETFTYSLACELKRLGHGVTCFSPRLGRLSRRLREADIAVTDDLGTLSDDVDIIHAHHRHESLLAFARFSDKPMIVVCHGVLPWQEQPLRSRLNVHRYVAVSEEVRDHLIRHHRIDGTDVTVIRNGIDLRRFASRRPTHARPRHALILSNYMPDTLRTLVVRVCGSLGISVGHIGGAQPQWAVEEALNQADLVFALGRSALEALACERAVIVFDYNGADGLVTPANFHLLRRRNFSGRTYRLPYTEETLRREIEQYDPTTAAPLHRILREEHDIRAIARQYLALYEEAALQPLWGRAGHEELALRHYRAIAELTEDVSGMRTLVAARNRSLQAIHDSRSWRLLSAIQRMRTGVVSRIRRPAPLPRKTRILVVDDDALLTRFLVEALTGDGHEVDVAHDGHDALQQLEGRAYDLILSDLRMPQMDGVELYRRLERDRPEAARHVMFLSGASEASEYEDFLNWVPVPRLTKPVDLPNLQRLVRLSVGVGDE